MKRFCSMMAALGALWMTQPGAANLLQNPDFDPALGLVGWTWLQDGTAPLVCGSTAECGTFSFTTTDDCCNQTSPGAAMTVSSFFDPLSLVQCVGDITPSTSYDFGTWMRVTTDPGFQPGLPYVALEWFDSSDCSGVATGIHLSAPSAIQEWTRVAVPGMIAPPTAQSARISLVSAPTGNFGSSVGMQFDGAFFGPSGSVPVELQAFSVD